MGWGMTIKNVFVSRIRKYDIDYKIEETNKNINQLKTQIYMFAAATPRIVDTDDGKLNWEEYVQFELNRIIEEYDDNVILLRLLYEAKNGEVVDD